VADAQCPRHVDDGRLARPEPPQHVLGRDQDRARREHAPFGGHDRSLSRNDIWPASYGGAGGGLGGHRRLDGRQVRGPSVSVTAPRRLREPVTAARADERNDVLAAAQDPRDGHLGDRRTGRPGDGTQRLDEGKIVLQVLTREARQVGAKVGGLPVGRPVARQEPAREHSLGGDGDAELAGHGQDLGLDAAGDQGVLDLQVRDRVHGGRAAQGARAHLRQSDVPRPVRPRPMRETDGPRLPRVLWEIKRALMLGQLTDFDFCHHLRGLSVDRSVC
jgi:hypothetical protein